MLSLQEAMQLDFTGGLTDMDVGFGFGFGFDKLGSDSSHNTVSETCAPPADVNRAGEGEEEERQRRLRRKISNRESARRSRARKQQRMEELERDVEALRAGNLALAARLDAAALRALAVRGDNARLHAEASALRRRLGEAQSNAAVLLGLSRLLRPASQGGGAVNGTVRGRVPAVPPRPGGGVASLMT